MQYVEPRSGYQITKTFRTYGEIVKEAVDHLKSGRIDECEKELNVLFNDQPTDPLVLSMLSMVQLKRGAHGVALLLIQEALRLHEKRPLKPHNLAELYNNLGFCHTRNMNRDEARDAFLKCAELDKDAAAQAYANVGSLYVNEGAPDKGIYYSDRALKINPDYDVAKWNKAICLLEKSKFGEGFDLYEAGFKTGDRVERNYGDKKTPFWDGSPGKTVVVYGEQGIGDEIMLASMLPDLAKTCDVIFECHPRLTGIFRNSFDFPVYGTRKAKELTWPSLHNFDAKMSIASLGKFFRRSAQDFPDHSGYLKADHSMVVKYKKKLANLSDKPKIGIHWEGGTKQTNRHYRSLDIKQLESVFTQDATFISLQYTPEAQEQLKPYPHIHHWQDTIDDYDETAGLVANLDLVISVCTSIIHLAGALGTPCWVMTPDKPAWRYSLSGKMLWYPKHVLYRQTLGDWEKVIQQVSGDLCSLLANRTKN